MSIAARIKELGLVLPSPPTPVAAYVPCVRSGNLLFISGQIPMKDSQLTCTGIVPDVVSLEQAQDAARLCALNGIAVAASMLEGDLDRITRIVRLGIFVASSPAFTDQPKVANGASELMQDIFGDAGRHARAAVGSVNLPLGASVEIEMLVEVRD